MMEDHEAPIVPQARCRNSVVECPEPTKESLKEESDALNMEAPFVPMVKRSSDVVNT
ncbi:MAG: hypothetical protein U5J64_10235 [Halobacteriales archaeon]|nr:hypothetical protein [Halobacteriales archaeon]